MRGRGKKGKSLLALKKKKKKNLEKDRSLKQREFVSLLLVVSAKSHSLSIFKQICFHCDEQNVVIISAECLTSEGRKHLYYINSITWLSELIKHDVKVKNKVLLHWGDNNTKNKDKPSSDLPWWISNMLWEHELLNVCKISCRTKLSLLGVILYPRPLCEVDIWIARPRKAQERCRTLFVSVLHKWYSTCLIIFLQAACTVHTFYLHRAMLMTAESPQTMLNSHTEAFWARQLSSNHFPLAVVERMPQFWLRPPSGCRVISVSQFLKRTPEPDWSTQWPSVTMSLMPSQMCSSGPMLWRT